MDCGQNSGQIDGYGPEPTGGGAGGGGGSGQLYEAFADKEFSMWLQIAAIVISIIALLKS